MILCLKPFEYSTALKNLQVFLKKKLNVVSGAVDDSLLTANRQPSTINPLIATVSSSIRQNRPAQSRFIQISNIQTRPNQISLRQISPC